MHNNILSTISSTTRRLSAAGTKRAAWLLLATAALLPCRQDAMAQSSGSTISLTPAIPGSVKDLPGQEITRTTVGNYLSVGYDTDENKQFVLYNVGTGLFLGTGGYWSSHAALTTIPRPFWLHGRSEDTQKQLPSSIRYPESQTGDANSWGTLFFQQTRFQVGSAEGSRHGNATYDKLIVVRNGETIYDYSGTVGDGTAFMREISNFSFANDESYIEAVIDITNTGGNESACQNILSVGQNITEWHTDQPCFHLYAYEKEDASGNYVKRVRVDDQGTDFAFGSHRFGGSDHVPISVGADNKVYVKITKDNIVVNGASCVPAVETKTVYRDIAPIFNCATFTATKGYADGSFGRHYYDIPQVTVDNIDIKANAGSDGKFIQEYPGKLKSFEATIDLTNCSGTNENIISIGDGIASWGGGKQNIHFYYTQTGGKLQAAFIPASGADKDKKDFSGVYGKIKVKVDEDGVHITKLSDNTELDFGTYNTLNDITKYLLYSTSRIQIGSAEGSNRSKANYENVSITYVKGEETEHTQDLFASGNTEDCTISFAKNEFFQGDISLDGVAEGTALLTLKAAAAAGSETTTTNLPGLTFTYQGEDDGHDVVQVKYEYDAASLSLSGYTRAINVEKGDKLSFKLSGEGLVAGGKSLFPSGNLLPDLPYNADLAGQTVHFKTDGFGNFLLDDNNKFIIDQANGKAFTSASSSGYLYSMDDSTDGVAVFISSKFRKRNDASVKEGTYMAWRPYDTDAYTYGDIGVFADRSLKPKGGAGLTDEQIKAQIDELLANSRWFFEPVTDAAGYDGKHIYRIYLDMKDQKVLSVVNKVQQESEPQSGKFYLHAKQDMVLGNDNEPYANAQTSTQANEDPTYTTVEAEILDDTKDDKTYWQLIPVSEYLQLFKGAKTDFEAMLDYSYLLADPNFSREDAALTSWVIDETLLGEAHETEKTNSLTGKTDTITTHDIRIGYDYYTKKSLTDVDYTDEDGVKTDVRAVGDGTYKQLYETSDGYKIMSKRERNHARYMGFEVLNSAKGRLYQEVTVNGFGWYAITCKGFSTATKPAVLFIQKASDGDGDWVSSPLHTLSVSEDAWLRSTKDKDWPYDNVYIDNVSKPLPLYNALVAMNDENTHTGPMLVNGNSICGQELIDSLTTQVIFYVSKSDLDENGEVKLRFGINVENGGNPGGNTEQPGEIDAPRRPGKAGISIGGTTESDFSFTLAWTVFDDFHLLYGGNAPDPHLVLNEDSTSLDYIDNSVHRLVERPMNLVRTFRENSWNTIILPVNLSQDQFEKAFGTDAKLAELDYLTEKTIEFKTVTEQDGVLLQAFKPYIIYIGDYEGREEGEEYEGKLYMLGSKGLPKEGDPYYKLYAPAGNYYASSVTLEPNYTSATTTKGYDFAHDSQAVTDSLYTYQGTTAIDASGTHSPLIAYGTLCKTYTGTDDGQHALLANRPTLQGAYVFNSSTMIKIHNSYGVKGFRCWFTTTQDKGNSQSLSNMAVSIDGIWNGTTTIGSINATNDAYDNSHADGVYSLSGQKLRPGTSLDGLPAGIYIVNGVKQSVR